MLLRVFCRAEAQTASSVCHLYGKTRSYTSLLTQLLGFLANNAKKSSELWTLFSGNQTPCCIHLFFTPTERDEKISCSQHSLLYLTVRYRFIAFYNKNILKCDQIKVTTNHLVKKNKISAITDSAVTEILFTAVLIKVCREQGHADCHPVTCQLIKRVHQRNKGHRDRTDGA